MEGLITYDVGGSVADAKCDKPCLGDPKQMCGGPSLNHVMRARAAVGGGVIRATLHVSRLVLRTQRTGRRGK